MLLSPAESVWWKEGEAFLVGRLMKTVDEQVATATEGLRLAVSIASLHKVDVLVQLWPEGTLKFVHWQELFHYYGDKEGKVGLSPHPISQPRFTDDILKFQRELDDKIGAK